MLSTSYTQARSCTLVVSILLCLFLNVYAHSPPSRPLKRLAHPSTLGLEILPRSESSLNSRSLDKRSSTLLHSDSFRLTISAFGDVFHLHLSPNDHLVHPQAQIKVYNSGSSEPQVLPLLRENVLAYMGHVISDEHTEDRMREDVARVTFPATPSLGWARIMVHSQGSSYDGIGRPPIYSGAFAAHGTVYHVMPKETYVKTKLSNDPHPPGAFEEVDEDLVIWRDSDLHPPAISQTPKAQTCAHDSLSYNTDPWENQYLLQSPKVEDESWFGSWGLDAGNSSHSKRDDVAGNGMSTNFIDQIGQTSGCPKTQKVLFMGVAADCKYVSTYGDHDNATTQILTNWNSASALYKETFNVSLGITELQVMNNSCPQQADSAAPWNVDCAATSTTNGQQVNLNERLSLFSTWRGQKGDDGIGLWHLMSGCPTGSEVGIAWLATLCKQDASGDDDSVVSGTGVSTSGKTEWQVVAHEIGHNFGAIHDCGDGCNSTSSCCPLSKDSCDTNSKFIMSPVAEAGETTFSQCSIGNICSVMVGVDNSQTNTTCLVDATSNTRQTISLKMCGNGILEPGEECDPGRNSDSPCCDSSTCKFKNGAVCDPASGHSCCTEQCSFASSNTVCRASKDAKCDQEEKCPGNNGTCPEDKFTPNGQSCGSDDLRCASGQCTSVSQQCQTLGASMGLKAVCPNRSDNTCQVSCQDPNKANACVLLNAMLIDGSPCGYGGSCASGKCQSTGFLNTAVGWYTQNLQISIPITVVAGLLVLAILFWLFRGLRNCLRSRPSADVGRQRLGSYEGMPSRAAAISAVRPPPPSQSRSGSGRSREGRPSRSQNNWVDPSPYNGANRSSR